MRLVTPTSPHDGLPSGAAAAPRGPASGAATHASPLSTGEGGTPASGDERYAALGGPPPADGTTLLRQHTDIEHVTDGEAAAAVAPAAAIAEEPVSGVHPMHGLPEVHPGHGFPSPNDSPGQSFPHVGELGLDAAAAAPTDAPQTGAQEVATDESAAAPVETPSPDDRAVNEGVSGDAGEQGSEEPRAAEAPAAQACTADDSETRAGSVEASDTSTFTSPSFVSVGRRRRTKARAARSPAAAAAVTEPSARPASAAKPRPTGADVVDKPIGAMPSLWELAMWREPRSSIAALAIVVASYAALTAQGGRSVFAIVAYALLLQAAGVLCYRAARAGLRKIGASVPPVSYAHTLLRVPHGPSHEAGQGIIRVEDAQRFATAAAKAINGVGALWGGTMRDGDVREMAGALAGVTLLAVLGRSVGTLEIFATAAVGFLTLPCVYATHRETIDRALDASRAAVAQAATALLAKLPQSAQRRIKPTLGLAE